MTVKELLQRLQMVNPDLPVLLAHFVGEDSSKFSEVLQIVATPVKLEDGSQLSVVLVVDESTKKRTVTA